MIEIEFKFEIDRKQIKRLRDKLILLGFIKGKRVYEKTVMYDNPSRIMQVTDGRVRLRQTGDESEFSYKKPLTREGIKKEIEYEVVVSDFETTEKILEKLDFSPVSSYERFRTTMFDKKMIVKVTLDEFPFANFLEIEGPEKEITALVQVLGFSIKDNTTMSCDSLFQEWRGKKSLPFKPHLLFTDFDK